MGFWLAVSDKRTLAERIPLIADGQFHLIPIDGIISRRMLLCDMEYELDLFGYQASTKASRTNGTVWAEFVRLPAGSTDITKGDAFSPTPFPVWVEDAHWGAHLTPKRTTKPELPMLGVAYRTEVPGLTLANDYLNADPA